MAKGDVIVVRYADDLVVGFQHRTDAERFLREFRERLAKFGLELHPDKTRSSGGSPLGTGSSGERENQRPSPSWALPLLWATPQERNLHRMADYCEKANGCETQSHQG